MIWRRLFSRSEPGIRQILLHSHIFKNAGSTIDWALQRSFGSRFVDHRDDRDMIQGKMPYVQKFLEERPQVIAISSHQMPFDPDFQTPEFSFWQLFMLRHPIVRALSVYQYEKTQPEHISLGAKTAKSLSMRDYFKWRMQDDAPAVLRDFQVRCLSGRRHRPRYALQQADFDVALRHARSPQVLIGFVERFDESMLRFEDVLKPTFVNIDLAHVIQNRGRQQVSDPLASLQEELGDDLYGQLCEKNAMDTRLYDALLSDFDAHNAGMTGFVQRLTVFRDRCAELHD